MIDLGIAPPRLRCISRSAFQRLHGMEHARMPSRTSEYLDLLVDVKALTHGTERVGQLLVDLGMEFDGANLANVGRRFVGRGTTVDGNHQRDSDGAAGRRVFLRTNLLDSVIA